MLFDPVRFRYASLTRAANSGFSGRYGIPVLIPWDLIGLKIQALINNPERKTIEKQSRY